VKRSPRFVLTPPARDDLTAISAYLRQDSAQAAQRVRAALREAMRHLAQTPLMGHLREDLTDEPVRFWAVYSYIIVYEPETQPLQILRILHSARDVRRILDEE
jgi:plasmid stabilization system protein ParE